jgi:hypothetical protein
MLTLKLDPKEASVEDVRRRLDLKAGEIDESFGVVSINPAENLYCVLVEAETADRVSGEDWVQGPFANPRIETFGPPHRGNERKEPDQDR